MPSGGLRLYSGTGVAAAWLNQELRDYLFSSLLYYPSVVVHDPLAVRADRRRGDLLFPPPPRTKNGWEFSSSEVMQLALAGNDPRDYGEIRALLEAFLPVCADLAPLFRSGVIVPVAPWKIARQRQQAILAAVRHDVRDSYFVESARNPMDELPAVSDVFRASPIQLNSGLWRGADEIKAVAQDPSYFLNRTLAIADTLGARYVPTTLTDQRLFEAKLGQLPGRNFDMAINRALTSAPLPFFRNLDTSTLLNIRTNEESFEEWRSDLRNTIRTIEASVGEEKRFALEAREILSDVLIPRANELKRQTQLSSRMRGVSATEVAELSIGCAVAFGAAEATNVPLTPAIIASLGATSALKWLYKTVFGDSPTGSRAVLASLVNRPGVHRAND
ncbi:hypothetical protein GA0074694_0977 [Micromonospora inyonensis]|uniref:Uncharacterized protein n=2 Tax=Micromonospora inyonensis TaxID=47866 RepID=A0A1C6RD13_9ACTN|nr:hypothetical protein GA0074694_0977 [Micromonospora inyonensis]